ncbi:MAG TPA: hypothetical protein VF508_11495 [Pyrinomonadaceae bacterium]
MVLDKIDRISDETPEGEEDPRLDMLVAIADRVVRRMNALVRECPPHDPALLAQWNEDMRRYDAHHETYSDIILQDDTLVDIE